MIRIFIVFGNAERYDFRYATRVHVNRRRYLKYHPTVSVIIPAYNEEKTIYNALRSIYNNKYQNLERAIVVDNNCTDRTDEEVRRFIRNYPVNKILLLHEHRAGKSYAINKGLHYENSHLTMVLDADSTLTDDAIERMTDHFLNPKMIAVATNVKIRPRRRLVELAQSYEYLNAYRSKCNEIMNNDLYIIGGIGSTFLTKALKQIHGYDHDTSTEDIDITLKLLEHFGNVKYKIGYAHDVIVYTMPVTTWRDLVRQRYRWKFGRLVAFRKYRNLFYDDSGRLSRILSYVKLPCGYGQEIFMLLEPYICLYIMALIYNNLVALVATIGYTVCVSILSFWDRGENRKYQLMLLVLSPLNFFLQFGITVVEYICLWKSIFNVKHIIHYRDNKAGWKHVKR